MAVPIRIKAIDHVVLRVRDLERAIAFYTEIIGCTVERRRDDLGLVHLRAGASQIDLVDLDGELGRPGGAGAGRKRRNMDHFAIAIEDFDEAVLAAHLKAHGIDPGEVKSRFGAGGTGKSMYLQDPDGNTVELKGPPED